MPCILHAMYLITHFKYLYFNYLTTLQTNTQKNPGFSHAVAYQRLMQFS